MNENEKQCWIEIRDAINKMLIADSKGYETVEKKVEEKQKEITVEPEKPTKQITLEDVINAFDKDLREQLYFEDKDGHILVKPRQYLGSDTFRKVSAVVKTVNGQYVSAGKGSHFRIPKRQPK